MKNTFDNEFINIQNMGDGFGFYTWKAETEKMKATTYHEQNTIILSMTKEHNFNKHLLDAREFKFPISPEVQKEVAERFFAEIVKLGKQKVAFLVPTDLFAQVSLEQVMEEEESQTLLTRYFDSEEEAKKWLLG